MLQYEFEMYRHGVPVSLPAVMLSTGRSILRDVLPVTVPLRATRNAQGSVGAMRDALAQAEDELAAVRSYLAAASQLLYDLTEPSRQMLVSEFVAMRQRDPAFGAEQFQTQLSVRGSSRVLGA